MGWAEAILHTFPIVLKGILAQLGIDCCHHSQSYSFLAPCTPSDSDEWAWVT